MVTVWFVTITGRMLASLLVIEEKRNIAEGREWKKSCAAERK